MLLYYLTTLHYLYNLICLVYLVYLVRLVNELQRLPLNYLHCLLYNTILTSLLIRR